MVSISSSEEHGFLIQQLNSIDPQHRRWYIGAHQTQPNPDGTQFTNMESAFLPEHDLYGKDYLAYNFTRSVMHWSFQLVRGDEPFLFICEANIAAIQRLVSDERDYISVIGYGQLRHLPSQFPRSDYATTARTAQYIESPILKSVAPSFSSVEHVVVAARVQRFPLPGQNEAVTAY